MIPHVLDFSQRHEPWTMDYGQWTIPPKFRSNPSAKYPEVAFDKYSLPVLF